MQRSQENVLYNFHGTNEVYLYYFKQGMVDELSLGEVRRVRLARLG